MTLYSATYPDSESASSLVSEINSLALKDFLSPPAFLGFVPNSYGPSTLVSCLRQYDDAPLSLLTLVTWHSPKSFLIAASLNEFLGWKNICQCKAPVVGHFST